MKEKPKSLDEVDPKLLETYSKLGIPLTEQKKLAGVIEESLKIIRKSQGCSRCCF